MVPLSRCGSGTPRRGRWRRRRLKESACTMKIAYILYFRRLLPSRFACHCLAAARSRHGSDCPRQSFTTVSPLRYISEGGFHSCKHLADKSKFTTNNRITQINYFACEALPALPAGARLPPAQFIISIKKLHLLLKNRSKRDIIYSNYNFHGMEHYV